MKELKNEKFVIQSDEKNRLVNLRFVDDNSGMNWIEGKNRWGRVISPEGIHTLVERGFLENGNLWETYSFKNTTEFPIAFKRTDIGIYTTFNDNYEDTQICIKDKCHTHIFCGEEASYVMALHMGGKKPHLGMKTIEGSIASYSIERDLEEGSNDRGDFILHPDIQILQPGESTRIKWEIFCFNDKEEFRKQLLKTSGFPVVEAKDFTYFVGETINLSVTTLGEFSQEQIKVWCNKEEVEFSVDYDGKYSKINCQYLTNEIGEHRFEIIIAGRKTYALFLVCNPLYELIEKRCHFIADKQQYHKEGSLLDGAYLIYDNEEDKQYYSHLDDHNGGRERICMGILLARFLQKKKVKSLLESLEKYVEYVYRELYDRETGIVYNDVTRNLDWNRLYNYPWMSLFQLELYNLFKDTRYLEDSFRTMKRYYKEGGRTFYGIAIPAVELISCLELENMKEEADIFRKEFIAHSEQILENGINYPPFEVRFEQSIVAPAISCLLQAYVITKDKKFFCEGKKQLEILNLFNGNQPDYHQYEVSIRHWDGYWFGKYRNYGDTYPHHWSTLTGIVYLQYSQITGSEEYREKARASFRGCLNLFRQDGSASCAMVFPETVNGEKGYYYDPWANDQDWALYFALRHVDTTI